MDLLAILVSNYLCVGVVKYAHPPQVLHKHFLVVLSHSLFLVILDFNVLDWLCFPLEDLLSAQEQEAPVFVEGAGVDRTHSHHFAVETAHAHSVQDLHFLGVPHDDFRVTSH